MAKPSQVLICIPMLLIGGTEMQTLNLVRVLVPNGYHVSACCYYEYEEVMVSEFRSAAAKVILMRLKRSDGLLHLMQEMKKVFKTVHPNIVHVQYVAPGLIPIISARLSGIRTLFVTVHQPGTPYGLKAKLFLRLGAYLSTAFFCVSKSAEKSWFGACEILNPQNVNRKRKHFTIYNAVDVSLSAQAANSTDRVQLKKSLGLDRCPVTGVVGRLRKEKGHLILLNAMAEVIKELPDTKLLVVGDGPDRNQLKTKAKILGIADRILWLGAKEPAETLQLYSIMNVVAVPSLFEGFGLTAAEAMAAGRPVVASDVDGLSEVVENGQTGYLVPYRDSGAMAKRLVELLSNPSKAQAMGEAGLQRVIQHFSLERFAEATLTAYRHFPRN
jgi:glycosyltransferase involved in cell wall biosynthesis